MKKKFISTMLSIAILLSSAITFTNKAEAIAFVGDVEYNPDRIPYLFTRPTDKFEFNALIFLGSYASDQTSYLNYYTDYRHDVNSGELIPLYQYEERDRRTTGVDMFRDRAVNSKEASFIRGIDLAYFTDGINISSITLQDLKNQFKNQPDIRYITYSLVDYLKAKGVSIGDDDVTITATSKITAITGFNDNDLVASVSKKGSVVTLSESDYNKYREMGNVSRATRDACVQAAQCTENNDDVIYQTMVSLTATTPNGDNYRLVLGTDDNWYLLKNKSGSGGGTSSNPTPSDPTPNNPTPSDPTPGTPQTTTKQKLKVNFIVNGGTKVDSVNYTITAASQLTVKVDLPTTSKDGFKFLGWYVDEKLTTKTKVSKVGDYFGLENVNTDPKDDTYIVNLYAKWQANKVDNPQTGVRTSLFVTGGVIAISAGAYVIAKKKNLFNKI